MIIGSKLTTSHIGTLHRLTGPSVLTYGDRSLGSNDLHAGVADYISAYSHPSKSLVAASISILNGVSSVIDSFAWRICDEDDGVLIGRPFYVGFLSDLENRAKITPVYVNFGEDDVLGFSGLIHYEQALRGLVRALQSELSYCGIHMTY